MMSHKMSGEERGGEFLTNCWHHLRRTWLREQRCGETPCVWVHVFTSLCSEPPPACPRWLVLCFEFEVLCFCQDACQLLYLLDAIKVFSIIYLVFFRVLKRGAFIHSPDAPHTCTECKPFVWKKTKRQIPYAALKKNKTTTMFWNFFQIKRPEESTKFVL